MTDRDLISRQEVLNAIGEEKWEYLDYLKREIGGNYDVHILGFTGQIEKRIEELPTYSPTFKPIAEIKIDSDEVVKRVLEQIKNGEFIISSDSAEHTDSDLAEFLLAKVKDFESVAIRVKHNTEHIDRLIDYIHGVIKNAESNTFLTDEECLEERIKKND